MQESVIRAQPDSNGRPTAWKTIPEFYLPSRAVAHCSLRPRPERNWSRRCRLPSLACAPLLPAKQSCKRSSDQMTAEWIDNHQQISLPSRPTAASVSQPREYIIRQRDSTGLEKLIAHFPGRQHLERPVRSCHTMERTFRGRECTPVPKGSRRTPAVRRSGNPPGWCRSSRSCYSVCREGN